jgi:APA family basic amino acid/polyamine antiporter
MLVYVGSTISVMGILPPEVLRQSVTPFSDAAGMITGNASRYLVSTGMAIAAFGALNGWILIQGQVPHAIARDNLFPSVFGKENGKGVPAAGIIISSIFCSILMIMNYSKNLADQFKIFVLLATMTTLVPYLFSAASLAILQNRNKQSPARTRLAGFILPFAAFCFTVWALAGSGKDIVFWGFLMLLAGIPFYVWMKVRKPINNLKSAP